MKRWRVNVGYMVPHYATVVVEADGEDEARRIARAQADQRDVDYQPDIEAGGPLQTFDCFRAFPSDAVTYPEAVSHEDI